MSGGGPGGPGAPGVPSSRKPMPPRTPPPAYLLEAARNRKRSQEAEVPAAKFPRYPYFAMGYIEGLRIRIRLQQHQQHQQRVQELLQKELLQKHSSSRGAGIGMT